MINKKISILVLGLTAACFWGCESKTNTSHTSSCSSASNYVKPYKSKQSCGVSGGLIHADLNESEQQNLQKQSPQTYRRIDNCERLSVNDIINLSKANISNDKIIDLIQKTDSHYTLNSYQIDRLRDAGVSEDVLSYMMYKT